MNLTINPLEFKNAFYGNNIKKDRTPNNYYEGSKIDDSSAITSYATASINLKKGASEKPKNKPFQGMNFLLIWQVMKKIKIGPKKC